MITDRTALLGDFADAKAFALSHCVLAHHGADALPGRRYASVEAVALQRLNSVDTAVKGALEHGLGLDQRA
jgi:3'-5' exoribonuclease